MFLPMCEMKLQKKREYIKPMIYLEDIPEEGEALLAGSTEATGGDMEPGGGDLDPSKKTNSKFEFILEDEW